ncbi:LysR family transcriptional regulator [Shewanella dokdonensis]|uniref:helix-turn-helix domain-containing protein n=1 Tax=Shewanella dokdonensis TaxID=712036 RepID=UPI003140C4A3
MGMSRPMISRYLAEMEDWAGTRLLHRSSRKLSLTPAGATAITNPSAATSRRRDQPSRTTTNGGGNLAYFLRPFHRTADLESAIAAVSQATSRPESGSTDQ